MSVVWGHTAPSSPHGHAASMGCSPQGGWMNATRSLQALTLSQGAKSGPDPTAAALVPCLALPQPSVTPVLEHVWVRR